jgi:hypothetical protein
MKKTLITLVFVAATAFMSVASTDALPDTIVLDEISVSAIKQGVSNDDASSTMVSQKDLEQHRIVTVKGVSDLIPNFYIPDYGSRITSSIYVRGIGARMDQPSVGLNIDNVPIEEAVAHHRFVSPDSQIVSTARDLGIIFGDRNPETMHSDRNQACTKEPKATRKSCKSKSAASK